MVCLFLDFTNILSVAGDRISIFSMPLSVQAGRRMMCRPRASPVVRDQLDSFTVSRGETSREWFA